MRKIKHINKKDIGAREEQQDSVDIIQNKNDLLLVLADGMGGHSGGRGASELFTSTARNHFKSYDYSNQEKFLNDIIFETENKINLYAKESNSDPHTTATLALIVNDKVYFANVGDSRVYIFNGREMLIRTRDHSVPEILFKQGEIEEHEMATHPDQNKLTKSLGPNSHTKATHYSYHLQDDNDYMVLVCSDGFWEYVTENEMRDYVFNGELENVVDRMIDLARERGGTRGDNISVGIVTLGRKKDTGYFKFFLLLLVLTLGVGVSIYMSR